MTHPGKARTALKSGSLIAAANWQVVAIQSVADTTFKLLLAVPIVGGGVLVTTLLGRDLGEVLAGDLRRILFGVAGHAGGPPARSRVLSLRIRRRPRRRRGADVPRQGRHRGVLVLADRFGGPG